MPGRFKAEIDKKAGGINRSAKKAARRGAELLEGAPADLRPGGKFPYLDFVVVELEPLIPLVFEPLVCPGA